MSSKKCVIFAGGEAVSRETVSDCILNGAFVIAADKGYALAQALGISPDVVIGDFDSLEWKPKGENFFAYPPEKDDTDLMLCIKFALDKGFDDFYLYGALGGRLDHSIGNLQCLNFMLDHNACGTIISDNEWVKLRRAGMYKLERKNGQTVSLLAFSEKVEGLNLSGFKYGAESIELTNSFPLGISNVIISDEAHINFSCGTLLIIQNKTAL